MILILIAFLIISSFILFITSRHDFVLLRQNISIRQVFDKAFIIIFFSLILSRAFYLVDQNLYQFFLEPLRFLHVVLYWGFNFLGFFTGIVLGILILFRKRKNILRILDIYLLSFFPVLFFESISFMIAGSIDFVISSVYLIILIVLFSTFIKMYTGYSIKDGVVAFCIMILSSLSYLVYSILTEGSFVIYSPIQIVAALVIAISVYCLVLIRLNFFKE